MPKYYFILQPHRPKFQFPAIYIYASASPVSARVREMKYSARTRHPYGRYKAVASTHTHTPTYTDNARLLRGASFTSELAPLSLSFRTLGCYHCLSLAALSYCPYREDGRRRVVVRAWLAGFLRKGSRREGGGNMEVLRVGWYEFFELQ